MQTSYIHEPISTLTDKIHCCGIRRYDLPEFGNAIFEAWRKLDSHARSMSALCFPAYCHFVLLDCDDNCIFVSEPELLGTDDDDIYSVRIPLTYDKFRHVMPVNLSRRLWRPEITPSDIPHHLHDKATKVNIYVRSTIDFPEWSLPAIDLVECLSHNRVLISPRPQSEEQLYSSTIIAIAEQFKCHPTLLLSRHSSPKSKRRKMLHYTMPSHAICTSQYNIRQSSYPIKKYRYHLAYIQHPAFHRLETLPVPIIDDG